jgi:signal transduction histidine kinase
LLETLLDISAAEAGVLKLDRDHIDVRSLTERAVDLYREVAEEKAITVTLDQPEPVEVNADAIRLGQVVNNLLDNALKYTPAGGRVVLTARSESKAALITVTDNGPGVPATEREAIFRRLYRGDSSRSQRGLGLGLSMVKAIVEAHGGNAAVDDAPGGGARFTVRLPR